MTIGFARIWRRWPAALLLAGAALGQDLVVKIGHADPTTGWMQRIGLESQAGACMSIDDLNARGLRIGGRRAKFELVSANDEAQEPQARVAAQTLLAAGVNGVVGHIGSGASSAAAPIYPAAGMPQISPSATSPAFTRLGLSTAFRVTADDTQIGLLLKRYVVDELKITRIVLVDDGSAYGRGLAAEFSRSAQAAGGRIVASQRLADTETDFTELLHMVQGAAAEAIFFGGFDRQLGLLIRQMSARGLGTLVVGGDSICTPDMASYYAAGAARDGQIVCVLPGGLPDTVNPAVDRFAARLAKHFEFEAKFYGAYAYDAVMVLADAMARTGSSNPAQVLPSLAQRRNFQGLTGTISFDDRGNLVEPALSLFNYRGEQRQLLRGVP